jgi:hypothetical protein
MINPNGSNITAISSDEDGNTYALTPTCQKCAGTAVTVYAPQATQPSRTIQSGLQSLTSSISLAVNASGSVFVTGDAGSLNTGRLIVYSPGKDNPARTVTKGVENPELLEVAPQ